jgi:hypothetical protein
MGTIVCQDRLGTSRRNAQQKLLLPCLVLPCLVMPCLVLSCPVLPCLVRLFVPCRCGDKDFCKTGMWDANVGGGKAESKVWTPTLTALYNKVSLAFVLSCLALSCLVLSLSCLALPFSLSCLCPCLVLSLSLPCPVQCLPLRAAIRARGLCSSCPWTRPHPVRRREKHSRCSFRVELRFV